MRGPAVRVGQVRALGAQEAQQRRHHKAASEVLGFHRSHDLCQHIQAGCRAILRQLRDLATYGLVVLAAR